VELGSGNVVSVTKTGADFHCRSSDPPTPSHLSGPIPGNFAAPARCESLSFVPSPSRIPALSSCGKTSPMTQAMRKGTPVKAAAVLGLPGTLMTSGEDAPCATPTKPRPIRNNRAGSSGDTAHAPARCTHLGKRSDQSSRSKSISGATKPGELPVKSSLRLLSKTDR